MESITKRIKSIPPSKRKVIDLVFILDTLNQAHSAEPTYMQKSNNQNVCSECGKNPLKRATFYSSVIDTTTGKFTNTDIMVSPAEKF